MRRWQLCNKCGDQRLPGFGEFFEQNRLRRHAFESATELLFERLAFWSKNLRHRPVVAQKLDDESAPQRVIDAFVCEKIACVEEITRMLPVKRRDDFPGVKIGKRNNANLCKPED